MISHLFPVKKSPLFPIKFSDYCSDEFYESATLEEYKFGNYSLYIEMYSAFYDTQENQIKIQRFLNGEKSKSSFFGDYNDSLNLWNECCREIGNHYYYLIDNKRSGSLDIFPNSRGSKV